MRKALIFAVLFVSVLFAGAGEWNFTIEEGATFERVITWQDANEQAIDITGYTVRLQVRSQKDASTTLLSISTDDGNITLSDPTNGIFTISVPPDTTAALDFISGYYDLEMVSPGGTVTRILQGIVELDREVTR